MIRFPTTQTDAERRRQVAKMRDVIEGEDRIKAAGKAYLPAFEAEPLATYRARLMRSSFPNFVRPTLDAIVGKATRVAPIVSFPDDRQPFLYRGDECSWAWGAEYLIRETATTGRLLCVVVPSEDPGVSVSAATRVHVYTAENIRKVTQRRGVVLSIIVEDECCDNDELLEYRIGEDGFLEAAVISSEGDDKRIAFPSIGGRKLAYIPAVFFGPNDLSPEPSPPPLIDLANAVLAHYVLQSEYRTALYMTATPQPVATGFTADELPRTIGPNTIIRSANPEAKFQFVTFSGDGIAEQRLALAASRADMAAIGISILLPKGASNIAARTVELRQAEDNSVTMSVINSVEAGLNRLMAYMLDWESKTADASITLNRDMVENTIDATLLARLREAYQAGMISWTTWIDALHKGEIIPASRSADDERGLIEADSYHDALPEGAVA